MWIYYFLIVAVCRSLLSSPGVYTLPMVGDDGVNDAAGLPPPDLPQGRDEDKSTRILKIMETKGLDFKNAIEPLIKQYLVVTVLSFDDFKRNDFETSDSVPETRTQVLLNLNITGLPSYYGVNKVHGEILTLYFNKTIDEFLQLLDVHEAGPSRNPPYVFVYSYYIPCAGLVDFPYSCAEELANAGRVNRNRYSLVVGYNTSYPHTNVPLALQYLQEGGITYIINITSGNVSRDRHKIEPEIYQQNMVDCLMQKVKSNFDLIDAVFIVNHVVKECTKRSDRNGYITQFGKAELHECVTKCSCIKPNYELRYCSLQTLGKDVRLMFGEPIDMCKAEWRKTPDDFEWKDLYNMYEQRTTTAHNVEHIRLRTQASSKYMSSLCTTVILGLGTIRKSNQFQRNGYERLRSDIKDEREHPSSQGNIICPLHSLQ